MKLLNKKEIEESATRIRRRIHSLDNELSGLIELRSILENQSGIRTLPPLHNPFDMEDEETLSKATGLPLGVNEVQNPFDQKFMNEMTETEYVFDELTGNIKLKSA